MAQHGMIELDGVSIAVDLGKCAGLEDETEEGLERDFNERRFFWGQNEGVVRRAVVIFETT